MVYNILLSLLCSFGPLVFILGVVFIVIKITDMHIDEYGDYVDPTNIKRVKNNKLDAHTIQEIVNTHILKYIHVYLSVDTNILWIMFDCQNFWTNNHRLRCSSSPEEVAEISKSLFGHSDYIRFWKDTSIIRIEDWSGTHDISLDNIDSISPYIKGIIIRKCVREIDKRIALLSYNKSSYTFTVGGNSKIANDLMNVYRKAGYDVELSEDRGNKITISW